MLDLRNEAELQATLELPRDSYNQHRSHQSLSGHTPVEAWHILERRKAKPKRPKRRSPQSGRNRSKNDRAMAVRESARLLDGKSFEMAKKSPLQTTLATHGTCETYRNYYLNPNPGPLPGTESVFADGGRHTGQPIVTISD
jgi:hypothetical protein